MVTIYAGGRRRNRTVHTLVAAAFIGSCPAGRQVRHLDGEPTNCAAVNLVYGTQTENELDKLRHGRRSLCF